MREAVRRRIPKTQLYLAQSGSSLPRPHRLALNILQTPSSGRLLDPPRLVPVEMCISSGRVYALKVFRLREPRPDS